MIIVDESIIYNIVKDKYLAKSIIEKGKKDLEEYNEFLLSIREVV